MQPRNEFKDHTLQNLYKGENMKKVINNQLSD